MNESLFTLNLALKDYTIKTPKEQILKSSIMSMLIGAKFVEAVFHENPGTTIALKKGKNTVLGSIVTKQQGDGIDKVRDGQETTLKVPDSWQALTQAATWIFDELQNDSNAGPLLAFAYLANGDR